MVGEGESGRRGLESWVASKQCQGSQTIVKGWNFIPSAMQELFAVSSIFKEYTGGYVVNAEWIMGS